MPGQPEAMGSQSVFYSHPLGIVSGLQPGLLFALVTRPEQTSASFSSFKQLCKERGMVNIQGGNKILPPPLSPSLSSSFCSAYPSASPVPFPSSAIPAPVDVCSLSTKNGVARYLSPHPIPPSSWLSPIPSPRRFIVLQGWPESHTAMDRFSWRKAFYSISSKAV